MYLEKDPLFLSQKLDLMIILEFIFPQNNVYGSFLSCFIPSHIF